MQVCLQVGKEKAELGYLELGAAALDRPFALVLKQCCTGSSVAVPCWMAAIELQLAKSSPPWKVGKGSGNLRSEAKELLYLQ